MATAAWLSSLTRWCIVIGAYSSLGGANTLVDSSAFCATSLFQAQQCGRVGGNTGLEYLAGTDEVNSQPNSGVGPQYTAHLQVIPLNKTWEIKPSPGKGLGVFATALIRAGTRIMVEEPLFSINPPDFVPGRGYEVQAMVTDVDEAVTRLSREQQDEFLSCHEYRLPTEASSEHRNMFIFRSNAYTLTDGTVAMFPKIAKINHSCRPNAANVWSEASRLRIIWAARDIEQGEEVTVTYAPLLKSHDERQRRLAQYGFRCGCEACLAHTQTDSGRVQMGKYLAELEERLSRNTSAFANKKLLPKATALVGMLEEEHMMDYLPNAYHLAAEISFRLQNITAAKDWAGKALRLFEYADERSTATKAALDYLEKVAS